MADFKDFSIETRRERASIALQGYVEAKGETFENSSSEAVDLIADLLHLVADIESMEQEMTETYFECADELEIKLASQVILSVLARPEMRIAKQGLRLIVEMNPSQRAEALIWFDLLQRSWRDEIGIFFKAFILRNKVFGPESTSKEIPTQAEIKEYLRAQAMAGNIQAAPPARKRIT